jgi:uncharacterized protein YegP (UPF0339 family)
MVAQVGYSVVGRSRGRVAPCAVYNWHVELGAWVSWLSLKTKVDGLSVVWLQNHWNGFSSVCASKLMAMVCEWFGLKTSGDGFWRFGLKTYCDSFRWFGLKTSGDGFWRFSLKTCCDGFCWFGLKTSGDGFSWFGLKTGGQFVG